MKEIRKEIREAILNEVGFSLARLGISGELFETKVLENKHDDTFQYKIESSPIQHTPMIFKKLIVSGSMCYIEVKEDDFLFNFSKKRDIIRVTLDYSYEHFGGGYFNDNTEGVRLWTIQDAKDGDVLAIQDSVFIFKHIDKTGRSLCKSYCEVIGNSGLGLGFEFSINGIHPATKEQSELLFQKMKEAGYEWDAEKKELKKIEHNPAWSEEDENIINKILAICNDFKRCFEQSPASTKVVQKDIGKIDSWFKSLKERYTWKPSDEQMSVLFSYAEQNNTDGYVLRELYNDLKKLKG